MREIGGYLEFENLICNEYYPNGIALNTARNALVYLVRAKNIEKLYIPYFLCDSISDVCDRENVPYEFYHTDKDFMPVFNKKLGENEFLYIVNYYGQLDNSKVKGYKEAYKNVIVDNVQAFFTSPVENVDTIYSCRKFFGVPDGAYLISNAPAQALCTDVSCDRIKHIFGRYDHRNASEYYDAFLKNENIFAKLPVMYMSRLTRNILGAIDYKRVIINRNENWSILHMALKDKNKLCLNTPEGPFMYPFYCENAGEIRAKMAKRNIYIPTLWPNVRESGGNVLEKDYAENILPLPLDQRYNIDDMKRLLDELFKIL